MPRAQHSTQGECQFSRLPLSSSPSPLSLAFQAIVNVDAKFGFLKYKSMEALYSCIFVIAMSVLSTPAAKCSVCVTFE